MEDELQAECKQKESRCKIRGEKLKRMKHRSRRTMIEKRTISICLQWHKNMYSFATEKVTKYWMWKEQIEWYMVDYQEPKLKELKRSLKFL